MPSLYVVAGPNGVGKTTSFKDLIPFGTDYINADLIAKTLKKQAGGLNVQDLANQEAGRIFYDKVKNRESFSVETNLCDVETYKSFIGLQGIGYEVNIFFMCVDDIDLCIERVKQRVSEGGHNVNPDVVRNRYETALKLLMHYKSFPDKLALLDNSTGTLISQAELCKGEIKFQIPDSYGWSKTVLSEAKPMVQGKDQFTSIEQVRELYSGKTKNKGTEL